MKFKGMLAHRKRRGEWAELQFMAAAAKHSLRVIKPMGDSATYDVFLETRGHFVRVQVKSTSYRRPEGCYKCNVRPARGRYKPGDFDFLAAYVIPEDLWYIIPAKRIITGKKSAIMLYTQSTTGRWSPDKENWDQIHNHRPRTT